MSRRGFSLGDPMLDVILGFLAILFLGVFILALGGLILAILVAKDGWDYASSGTKNWAVILTVIGVAVVGYTLLTGSNLSGKYDFIALGPFVAAAILGYQYSRRTPV